jgi:hypothetical protein
MHVIKILALAAGPVLLTSPAVAAHVGLPAYADARGTSSTNSLFSNVWFRSGQYISSGGVFDAGPQVPGATEVWATTASVTGPSAAASFASASLDRGELKATATVASVPFGTAAGSARADFADSIFFTNTSSGLLPITLTMSVDGAFVGPLIRSDLRSRIQLASFSCNGMGGCITPLANGSSSIFTELLGETSLGSPFQFREFFSGQINDNIAHWNLGFGPNQIGISQFDYFKTITLYVPTGLTTLNLQGELQIFCIGTGICDFTNTAALRFGALPEGLSFTSQSGVFLTGLGSPGDGGGGGTPGAVPEPASWAMMIAGFGLVGAAVRRRRAAALAC